MKGFVSLAAVVLSVLVGFPCAVLGVAGLLGILADVSHAENVRFGWFFLAAAGLIWGLSALWFWYWYRNAPER